MNSTNCALCGVVVDAYHLLKCAGYNLGYDGIVINNCIKVAKQIERKKKDSNNARISDAGGLDHF